MFDTFDVWKFLAGLGIFMFGMFLLEESIKQLSGKAFKRFIKTATTGRLRSIFAGIFSTAVLQSSSAVSLMTLAFVGAGVMSMQNGIGVIMGTNVGTTFTGWIVATLGFKLNIESFSLPLIGIGGMGLIFFSKSARYSGISKLFAGLGFLFMGLSYMKVSVEEYSATIDLETLPHYGLLFYVLLGFGITALMQSSSAALAVTLTAVNSGVIAFSEGTAMVIGANIGTTVTIMLGAVGGVAMKKQVAFSHVVFNVGTGIVALIILPFYLKLYQWAEPDASNYVLGIAIFHTFFNVLGVLVFAPFIGLLVKYLVKIFPEHQSNETLFLNKVSHDLPEAALHALYQETNHLMAETINLGKLLLGLKPQRIADIENPKGLARLNVFSGDDSASVKEKYEQIKSLQREIGIYASHIRHSELEIDEKAMIHEIIHVSMVLNQNAKTLAGIEQEATDLAESSNEVVRDLFEEIQKRNGKYWNQILNNEIVESDLENMKGRLEAEYESFISKVADLLNHKEIKEKHAASLLLVNGLLTGTNRQLFGALNNMKEIEILKAVLPENSEFHH